MLPPVRLRREKRENLLHIRVRPELPKRLRRRDADIDRGILQRRAPRVAREEDGELPRISQPSAAQ